MSIQHPEPFAGFQVIASPEDPTLNNLGENSRLIADAAIRNGGVCAVHPDLKGIIYVYANGVWDPITRGYVTFNDSANSKIADIKHQLNRILREQGLPVPMSFLLVEETWKEQLEQRIGSLAYPVVVKPNTGTVKGNGVVTNIRDREALEHFLVTLFDKHREVLVEKQIDTRREFRFLVLDGKVISIVERIPAHVIGDGVSTLQQLIDAKNIDRAKNEYPKIKIDSDLQNLLQSYPNGLQTVPSADEYFQLKKVANYGAGGDTQVHPPVVHPEWESVIQKLFGILPLKLMGLDILCDDVTAPVYNNNAWLLEVNPNPDTAMHSMSDPSEGIRIGDLIYNAIVQAW